MSSAVILVASGWNNLTDLCDQKGGVMENVSRRKFLGRTTTAAAAVGTIAAVPGIPGVLNVGRPTASSAAPTIPEGATLGEPIVAHVRDLATGEIDLFAGTRQVTIRDPQVVAKLFKASR